jgi:hypothetical protein
MFNDIQIPPNIEKIYIDIGLSSNAPYSFQWLSSDPNSFVFGFEPIKEDCEKVLEKVLDLGFGNRYKLYQCAVDNIIGQEIKDFYITCNSEVCGDHGQSSLFKLRDKLKYSGDTRYWVEKIVPTLCINLCDFLLEIDWERFKKIECLKIDTQGNDLNILKSIEKYFNKIPLIYCESHTHNQYEREGDDPNIIYQYMINNGYQLFDYIVESADHHYQRV